MWAAMSGRGRRDPKTADRSPARPPQNDRRSGTASCSRRTGPPESTSTGIFLLKPLRSVFCGRERYVRVEGVPAAALIRRGETVGCSQSARHREGRLPCLGSRRRAGAGMAGAVLAARGFVACVRRAPKRSGIAGGGSVPFSQATRISQGLRAEANGADWRKEFRRQAAAKRP